ncbi:sugar kinase [Neptunicella sp. SCSIO 80796]|uniref:sugar kinase n=1 Tax=Neptunicella plasticusilytica TaxID=3117012 RepID=UPI003A4E3F47
MSKIIIFGECMVELSAIAEQTYQQTFAGDSYNTAVYLKRCNPRQQVSYWSTVGSDTLSEQLLINISQENIATELVLNSPDKTLGLYMISTDEQGERSFAYWRSDSAARQSVKLLLNKGGIELLSDCDYLFFSGISLAILSEQDKQSLLDLLSQLRQQHGCKIIFDPNYRPLLWSSVEQARIWTDKAYALADIAFPGCDDHRVLYGHDNVTDVHRHVQALGVNEIVIKNGAQGVQIFQDGQHSIVPVQQVANVVDTTSAGDAFNGGYLAARFAGHSVQSSASFAAQIAAYVIGHKGAIVPAETMKPFLEVNTL